MEIDKLRFDFCLSEQDRQQIGDGISKWRKQESVAADFNGSRLYKHFEAWKEFVETNWIDWDISEYGHDIDCRYWIQLCIECSTPPTRVALERAAAKADAEFKSKMKPARQPELLKPSPLSHHPYFWETGTIHPALAA